MTSLFLSRRSIFAFLVIYCGKSIVLQVMLSDVLSTLLLAFYFTIWPMSGIINNAIQIVNEMVVIVSIWLMFWFTHYIEDAQVRYDKGWHFLYFVGADVALNIIFLFYFLGSKIYCACKRKFMARRANKMAQMRVDRK